MCVRTRKEASMNYQLLNKIQRDGNIIVEILNNGKKRDWQSIVNPSCEECPYGVFEQNNRERNDWQNTLNEILELYGIDEENMPLF